MKKLQIKTKTYQQLLMIEAFLFGLSYNNYNNRRIEYKKVSKREIQVDYTLRIEVLVFLKKFIPEIFCEVQRQEKLPA